MKNLCIFMAVTLFGYIGWSLGERFGIMTAFFISSIGSIFGVYAGWRIYRDYLS